MILYPAIDLKGGACVRLVRGDIYVHTVVIPEGFTMFDIAQAIQDAVTRNRLTIALPAKSTAQRLGGGYAQELFSNGNPAVRYLVAKADVSPTAYVVTGDYLTRYDLLGGPGGSLGYPASDGVAGGHQLFSNSSALAGSPVRLVSGGILAKWTSLNFESGAAGLPTSEATSIVSSSGAKAQQQTFAKGTIFATISGPRAGQAQRISGLILARYNAMGGPGGDFGLPVSDEFGLDGRLHQDFESGYIDYAAGDAVATDHGAARRPSVTASPASVVVAGSRLRLSVTGFTDGASLRVSITDQPDFVVTAASGSYIWETFVPLSAPSKTFMVHAVDASGVTADGSYAVKSLTESKLRLVKTQGDAQTAAPGAQPAQKLKVQLQDENGTPVIGIPVTFAASPGAQLISSTAVTDETGQAEAAVRLPPAEGLSLFTAEAARLVSTFSARAAAVSLPNFPAFLQSDAAYGAATLGKGTATVAQKGALLTSAAAIVRYYQNHGDLSGSVDPGSLNKSLQNADGFLTNPDVGEQVVNLWRLDNRLDVAVEIPDTGTVRDLVSQGSPALLALSLTANGAAVGGHYVAAYGVGADGTVLIRDPNPDFARKTLDEFLAGFQAGGQTWQATLGSIVHFVPRAQSATGFLMAAISQSAAAYQQLGIEAASVAGVCGQLLDLPDVATLTSSAPQASRLRYCDGKQAIYQLGINVGAGVRVAVYDLAGSGRRTDLSAGVTAFKATRASGQLALAPQDVTLTPAGIVNPATLSAGIAPGGLMAIFGGGLAGPGADSIVTVNGATARVVTSSPFQINAEVPPDLPPGTYAVRVQSPYGASEQTVEVRATAPTIYLVSGDLALSRGVISNQDGTVNAPLTPGKRGQAVTIYCTGLGAVSLQGDVTAAQFAAQAPVTVVLNKVEIQPAFAGLVPDQIGLYQVKLTIPVATPPGIDLPVLLRQAGGDSNTAFVAVQ